MSILIPLVVTIFLVAVTLFTFRRVRFDYLIKSKLAPFSSFLEVLIFFLHGAASYLFLDSNLGHIKVGSVLFPISILLIVGGLLLVAVPMSRLSLGTSVGQQVAGLRQSGLYQYTRNPQIVAYFLVVVGYALLWPSWPGVVWIAVYTFIAHVMVRTEEEHLSRVYGDEYEAYCSEVPRYLFVRRQKSRGEEERRGV